jgi:hypothetical protein
MIQLATDVVARVPFIGQAQTSQDYKILKDKSRKQLNNISTQYFDLFIFSLQTSNVICDKKNGMVRYILVYIYNVEYTNWYIFL